MFQQSHVVHFLKVTTFLFTLYFCLYVLMLDSAEIDKEIQESRAREAEQLLSEPAVNQGQGEESLRQIAPDSEAETIQISPKTQTEIDDPCQYCGPSSWRPDRVLLNTVPPSLRGTVEKVLTHLSRRNHFHYMRDDQIACSLGEAQQEALVDRVHKRLKAHSVLTGHFAFVNFTRFRMQPPFYIGVLQEPLVYRQLDYQQYNLSTANSTSDMSFQSCVEGRHEKCVNRESVQIQLLCGQHSSCKYMTEEAVARAKHTLVAGYNIIGIGEELPQFFFLLEKYNPAFFSGAFKHYLASAKAVHSPSTKALYHLSSAATDFIKSHLHLEYDLYQFACKVFRNHVAQFAYQQQLDIMSKHT